MSIPHSPQAVQNTILPAEDALSAAAAHYDLPLPVECEFIRRGFNDHYLVRAGDRRYVLRIYLNGKYYIDGVADFRFELDLLAFLHENGLPVSYPIARRDDDVIGVLGTSGGARWFTLFTFAEGETLKETSNEQARGLGEAVGAFHAAANRFRSPHRRYHLNLEYLLHRPMREIEAFLRERGKGSVEAYLPAAEALGEQILALLPGGDAYGIIHGDLHRGNMFFTRQDQPTLFDFDHGGYGWRAYDLAACKGSHSEEAWGEFLESYQSQRILSTAELASIPVFRKIRPIWDLGDILAMRTAWGDTKEFGDPLADQILTTFGKLFDTGPP